MIINDLVKIVTLNWHLYTCRLLIILAYRWTPIYLGRFRLHVLVRGLLVHRAGYTAWKFFCLPRLIWSLTRILPIMATEVIYFNWTSMQIFSISAFDSYNNLCKYNHISSFRTELKWLPIRDRRQMPGLLHLFFYFLFSHLTKLFIHQFSIPLFQSY